MDLTWIKKNWTYFALGIVATLLFKQCNKEPEIIEVPIKIEVPVPVIEKVFDTVYYPVSVPSKSGNKKIDSTYIKKWESLKNDSIAREILFKKAIEIKEYRERVEDDTITINLALKVRGDLLNYQVDYKTKPRNIILDTVIKIPNPSVHKIFLGGEVVLPSVSGPSFTPSVAPGVIFIPKDNKHVYKVSYDFINKTVTGGLYWRL